MFCCRKVWQNPVRETELISSSCTAGAKSIHWGPCCGSKYKLFLPLIRVLKFTPIWIRIRALSHCHNINFKRYSLKEIHLFQTIWNTDPDPHGCCLRIQFWSGSATEAVYTVRTIVLQMLNIFTLRMRFCIHYRYRNCLEQSVIFESWPCCL